MKLKIKKNQKYNKLQIKKFKTIITKNNKKTI